MSWGTELWDQYDNLSTHTQKGIDFCERFGHFMKERCSIESDYAAKLKKLVKTYLPKVEKGDKSDKKKDEEFSCYRGFYAMVKEVNDLAGQHEVIVENLSNSVLKELQTSIVETKQERKRLLADAIKQQNVLTNQMAQLDKAKSKYEKAFREAEKAQDSFKKAEADVHMTKADIEKAITVASGSSAVGVALILLIVTFNAGILTKQVMNARMQTSDDCKAEYAVEVQKTNDVQREHYSNLMPQLFNQLQDMEEKRVTKVQFVITTSAETERQVMPIISKCIDGMTTAATLINCKEDSRLVIDRFKTGFFPPNDVAFEDLSTAATGHSSNGNSKLDGSSKVGGTAAARSKKRAGLLGIFGAPKVEEARDDFGHLPPTQQKKQLMLKIEVLKANLTKETSERDGMLKMQDVYKNNTSLGDPATIEKQLEENAQKLDKLRQEIRKYENYLNDADRSPNGNQEIVTPTPSPQAPRHSSPTEESVRQSALASQPSPSQPQMRAERQVLNEQDSFDEEGLGTCVAVYEFQATTDTALSMTVGEQFEILERDEGDGWTHVRRANGDSGFIPTSYVQCNYGD